MAKDMSYEMFPGIRITDCNDFEMNHGKRLDTSKYKQLYRIWHENGYSEQEVRDKIGKNNGWAVCRSWFDTETKDINFEVLINADKTEVRTVKYADICKDYGWKSFAWVDDNALMILPQK